MRIVVADDDALSRLVLTTAVQTLGHQTLGAVDGRQAWDLICSEQPDVVITDRDMPDMDGIEVCRLVRSAGWHHYVYVILLTALSDFAEVLEGMKAGADDYLVKPLDPAHLETRLIAAQRVTSLQRDLADYRIQLEAANEKLTAMSRTDALMQIGNRLALDEDVGKLHSRSERHGSAYSLALFDVDFFKRYNDTNGHPAGDEVLRQVARVLRTESRASDSVYRYGGEEVVVVMPDESVAGSLAGAERLRAAVEHLGIPHVSSPHEVVTVSGGVSTSTPEEPLTLGQLVKGADAALYRAKASGRNCVLQAENDSEERASLGQHDDR